MKTVKFIAIAIFSLVTVSSCTIKEYYPNENWYSEDFEVRAGDWKKVGVGTSDFHYEFVFDRVPLDIAYKKGVVTAYLYLNRGTANETQAPLPHTFYLEEEDGYLYSVQYTYDIASDNTIAFKIYVSDFVDIDLANEYFKVAITW
jgi:hypothetical protein